MVLQLSVAPRHGKVRARNLSLFALWIPPEDHLLPITQHIPTRPIYEPYSYNSITFQHHDVYRCDSYFLLPCSNSRSRLLQMGSLISNPEVMDRLMILKVHLQAPAPTPCIAKVRDVQTKNLKTLVTVSLGQR